MFCYVHHACAHTHTHTHTHVQASPGNLQQLEGVLFSQSDAVTSTCVMAIKLTNENGRRMVGVAYAEPSLHKLGVSEFIENDQFSNVEVSGLLAPQVAWSWRPLSFY